MGNLTVLKVASIKKPGRYGDGDGLWLQVRGAKARSWLLRYTSPITGKPRVLGLGKVRDVGLAEARQAAQDAGRLIRQGVDPLETKTAEIVARKKETGGSKTFKTLAVEYIEAHREGWKNEKHIDQWVRTLEVHAFPKIGTRPITSINTDDVLAILQPIWSKVPETASRLRGRLEQILGAAMAEGSHPGPNPAAWQGAPKHRLPAIARMKVAAGQRHQPALSWQQMPAFMTALAAEEGLPARALECAILTGARSGEVRGMTWDEVDLEAGLWIIPGTRMKVGKLHRVPLSAGVIALLQSIPRLSADPKCLVFPGRIGRGGKQAALSDMSLSATVRRMNGRPGGPFWVDQVGAPVVPHGFRSTLRTWAQEATQYPREVAEAALAHTMRDRTEASYARSDHLERRRQLMNDWAQFISAAS